jgi:uncharacterized protein YbjT (DUF2867 family)
MKVILFGASGMVGQGVLRECLRDPGVTRVLVIGRSATGLKHPKLEEWLQADLFDVAGFEARLQGCDACFFCLGVSALGMSEADYRRMTFTLTLGVAEVLARVSPQATFVYVSGAGTDSSEHGRSLWARVKGATENALLRLPLQAVYLFRPGAIVPLHGIRSKTRLYDLIYTLARPLLPLLRAMFPKAITTTEQVGRAMLAVVRVGAPRPVLESADIVALGSG